MKEPCSLAEVQPTMKIVDVRITGLSGGTVDGGWPQGNKPEEDLHTIVEVLTDEGLSGVGSAMTSKAWSPPPSSCCGRT